MDIDLTKELLTSRELYEYELSLVPQLSKAEQRIAVEAARCGDEDAKEALIGDLLHFVAFRAGRLVRAYMHEQEYLDVVQVGNLAVVNAFDKTLATTQDPVTYLAAVARQKMVAYCVYYSKLIRLPDQKDRYHGPIYTPSLEEMLAFRNAEDDSAAWLEAPDNPLEEVIASLEPEEETGFNVAYGPLAEALGTLTQKERESIENLYGLGAYGEETVGEMSKRIGINHSTLSATRSRALSKLRAYLKRA